MGKKYKGRWLDKNGKIFLTADEKSQKKNIGQWRYFSNKVRNPVTPSTGFPSTSASPNPLACGQTLAVITWFGHKNPSTDQTMSSFRLNCICLMNNLFFFFKERRNFLANPKNGGTNIFDKIEFFTYFDLNGYHR